MFSVELLNRTNTNDVTDLFPSLKMMGCKKSSPEMKEFIDYLKVTSKHDNTNAMDFKGEAKRYLFKMSQEHKINIVNGKYFGVRNK